MLNSRPTVVVYRTYRQNMRNFDRRHVSLTFRPDTTHHRPQKIEAPSQSFHILSEYYRTHNV